jgi:hypothetical protein
MVLRLKKLAARSGSSAALHRLIGHILLSVLSGNTCVLPTLGIWTRDSWSRVQHSTSYTINTSCEMMTSLQYICITVTSGDSLLGPRILFELNCKLTVVYMDIKDWAKKLPWFLPQPGPQKWYCNIKNPQEVIYYHWYDRCRLLPLLQAGSGLWSCASIFCSYI